MRGFFIAAIMAFIFLVSHAVGAAEGGYTLRIQNHVFVPDVLTIPSEEKVKITIINEDTTPEEFESYELNREKIIKGKSEGIIFVGPLKPGTYSFFGEFNPDTAKGKIVVE